MPASRSRFTTSRLCISSPKVKTFAALPDSATLAAVCSVSSTARRTPKQNPALFARMIFNFGNLRFLYYFGFQPLAVRFLPSVSPRMSRLSFSISFCILFVIASFSIRLSQCSAISPGRMTSPTYRRDRPDLLFFGLIYIGTIGAPDFAAINAVPFQIHPCRPLPNACPPEIFRMLCRHAGASATAEWISYPLFFDLPEKRRVT